MRIIERGDDGWVLMQSEPVRAKVPLIIKAQGLYALWRWLWQKYRWYPHPTKLREVEYTAQAWMHKDDASGALLSVVVEGERVTGASIRTNGKMRFRHPLYNTLPHLVSRPVE